MKRLSALVFILLFSTAAFAQEVYNSSGSRVRPGAHKKKTGFDPQRLIFGGGLGLGFGTVTNIAVSPVVGYRITDKFSAGIGLGYDYLRVKDYYQLVDFNGNPKYYDYKTSIYSASVWARYLLFENVFVHAEYEHNFMSFTDYRYAQNGSGDIEGYKLNYNAPSLLLGGGFRQPISERSSFVAMALYDVLQDKYSPYYKTISFRVGVNVGF